jgi:hypothetical protein
MAIRSDEYNGVCVLTVDGSLTGETAAALRRGGEKLAAADANCQKILEITRLAHRFECHADVSAALKTMR